MIWQVEWGKVKAQAIAERGHKCEVCGYTLVVECDHVRPKARGGNHTFDNAILLCPNCHHLKNRVWPQTKSRAMRIPQSRQEVIAGIRHYIKGQKSPVEWRIANAAEDLIDYS